MQTGTGFWEERQGFGNKDLLEASTRRLQIPQVRVYGEKTEDGRVGVMLSLDESIMCLCVQYIHNFSGVGCSSTFG